MAQWFSSGRFCQERSSVNTASVTVEISSGDTSMPSNSQMTLDLPRGHTAGTKRLNFVVKALQPALAILDHLWCKIAVPTARNWDC